MQFPKFVDPRLSKEDTEELIIILTNTKKYIWNGNIHERGGRVREFICHAIEEAFEDVDWGYLISESTARKFIQESIDDSMDASCNTFECWYNITHIKIKSHHPQYNQYIIDLQSHRQAWIDYLIQNLKGN